MINDCPLFKKFDLSINFVHSHFEEFEIFHDKCEVNSECKNVLIVDKFSLKHRSMILGGGQMIKPFFGWTNVGQT